MNIKKMHLIQWLQELNIELDNRNVSTIYYGYFHKLYVYMKGSNGILMDKYLEEALGCSVRRAKEILNIFKTQKVIDIEYYNDLSMNDKKLRRKIIFLF